MNRYYRRRKGFDFGDFEITKREILASITILAVMLLIGFLIGGKISEYQMDKNEEFNKAVKITSTEMFQYGMSTNVGNAFVYGDLEAVDTVTYPEIGGEYLYVEKTEEHYNRHTRTVTKTRTNSKGETETYEEKEVYYSWDYYDSWNTHSSQVKFCKIIFPYTKISTPRTEYITTKQGFLSDVRFVYYGCKAKYTGTVYTKLQDDSISDNSSFYINNTIDETVKHLESGIGLILFWIFWIILTAGSIFAFYYFDNNWLE